VFFLDGKSEKAGYRRYRIKSVSQADDYAMMREVLSRRFLTNKTLEEKPDLIIIDGGIGQLGILAAVMAELGIAGIDMAGLAKSRVSSRVSASVIERSNERVFLLGRKNPVVLRQNSPALLLLARIRDEAHRFAITYHRSLRSDAALASVLDRIQGVGKVLRRELLERFGSVQGIRETTVEELVKIRGVSGELAARIIRELSA
jgi:excinuclease ABC subunit C